MTDSSQSHTNEVRMKETDASQAAPNPPGVVPNLPGAMPQMIDFTDAQFVGAMRRSMWNIAVLGVILAGLLTMFYGWRTGLMLLIGAAVSFTGVWEWQRLIAAINARMDANRSPHPLGRTLFLFVLRLTMVGVVLYGSLKYLEGSLYALVAGLSLAILMLMVEAFRMLKS